MKNNVFLDTAYVIAISVPSDTYHKKAISLAEKLEKDGTKIITTRAVLLEIGNALSKQRFRHYAVKLLEEIETDPNIEIVPLTEEIYSKAYQLFRDRTDKEWGLIDCVSFIVMQERGISEALTTDVHFQQMGFQALL